MKYFLEDNRIGLRCLLEKDSEGGYADWFNDAEVCMYNDHHRFPMAMENLIDFIRKSMHSQSEIVLAVEEKQNKKHIGNISLQHIDFVNRQAEIAFMFGEKEFWGKGYATSAAKLMIEHAFNELGINRIYFGTLDDNIGMQKVGEKLKFKKIGIRRQALYKNGSFHDIFDYDLLSADW